MFRIRHWKKSAKVNVSSTIDFNGNEESYLMERFALDKQSFGVQNVVCIIIEYSINAKTSDNDVLTTPNTCFLRNSNVCLKSKGRTRLHTLHISYFTHYLKFSKFFNNIAKKKKEKEKKYI